MNNHNNLPRTLAGDMINVAEKISKTKRATIDLIFTNKETEHPTARKVARVAFITLPTAAALTAAGHFIAEPGNTNPATYQEYAVTDAKNIEIEEGARLRHDPAVERQEGGNVAHVAEQDFSVSVPESFIKEDWRNGEWIGVDADVVSQEVGETIRDGDGILWVNTQKAHTETSD